MNGWALGIGPGLAVLAARLARAQTPEKMRRLVWLTGASPTLAGETVKAKSDVIVVAANVSSLAVKKETSTMFRRRAHRTPPPVRRVAQ